MQLAFNLDPKYTNYIQSCLEMNESINEQKIETDKKVSWLQI